MNDSGMWRTARLEDLCEINPKKPKLAGVDDQTPALFVPMAAVDESTGTITSPEELPLGVVGRKSYRSFTSGDVLFAKITPCMENGKAAIVPKIPSGYGFGSTEFHVLRPRPGVNAKLIWHFVRQKAFRQRAAGHFTGTVGQLRVPAEFLRKAEISLPESADRQAKLADLLDSSVALGGSATGNLTDSRQAIERFRQAVIAAACSGRLTDAWRSEHEHAEIDASVLLERIEVARRAALGRRWRKVSAPVDDLWEIPADWQWTTPEQLLEPGRAITYGVIKLGPPVADGVPTLRSSNVRWLRFETDNVKRIDQEIADTYARTYLRGGEVLITVRGTLGGVAVAPPSMMGWNISREVACLPLVPDVHPPYVALVIASMRSQQWLTGVTRGVAYTGVNIEDLKRLPLPLPSFDEQREIARQATQLMASANSIVNQVDDVSRIVAGTSQSILAKAFRGDLALTDE